MTTPPTLSAAAIESDRLVLRKARDTDREGIVEVLTDPEVRAYLGGPRPREGVERFLDQAGTASATAAPGSYVIADRQTDLLAGILGLGRRTAGRPGHVTAALRAAAEELPDQPVLVVTQTANHRARRLADRLGFQEVSVFEEFDAQQTLAVASLCSFRVL